MNKMKFKLSVQNLNDDHSNILNITKDNKTYFVSSYRINYSRSFQWNYNKKKKKEISIQTTNTVYLFVLIKINAFISTKKNEKRKKERKMLKYQIIKFSYKFDFYSLIILIQVHAEPCFSFRFLMPAFSLHVVFYYEQSMLTYTIQHA